MKKHSIGILWILAVLLFVGCQHTDAPQPEIPIYDHSKYLGADLSLLTRYEQNSAVYKDENGGDVKVLPFFKLNGFNYVRCRLFVNPDLKSDACQNLDYVIALSKRCKTEGFKVLLDFHYSDTWADPSKQIRPSAWKGLTQAQLITQIYDYTKSTLQAMKKEGVLPDMIQTGNEITPGLLLQEDANAPLISDWKSAAHWENLTTLLKSAVKACREVAGSETKIMIHTERSGDAESSITYYSKLKEYSVDYDVVGLSYYPYWHGTLSQVETTIQKLSAQFTNKEIVFVETAYPYSDYGYPDSQFNPNTYIYPQIYPSTPTGQASFMKDLIRLLRKYPNVKGLFYWFAEETCSPLETQKSIIHAGLFNDQTGKALPALKEMKTFLLK